MVENSLINITDLKTKIKSYNPSMTSQDIKIHINCLAGYILGEYHVKNGNTIDYSGGTKEVLNPKRTTTILIDANQNTCILILRKYKWVMEIDWNNNNVKNIKANVNPEWFEHTTEIKELNKILNYYIQYSKSDLKNMTKKERNGLLEELERYKETKEQNIKEPINISNIFQKIAEEKTKSSKDKITFLDELLDVIKTQEDIKEETLEEEFKEIEKIGNIEEIEKKVEEIKKLREDNILEEMKVEIPKKKKKKAKEKIEEIKEKVREIKKNGKNLISEES